MAKLVQCTCGQKLSVRDEYLGKRIKCPACGTATMVPDPRAAPPPPPPQEEIPLAIADDREEEPEHDDDRERRPRKRRKRKAASSGDGGFWGWEKRMANAGVLIGVLIMIGAVVWFVLGWMGGRIFFYPPILFVVGIIAVVKGVLGAGSDD